MSRFGFKEQGFTLLEVLIALSIFALISVGSFQLISSSVNYQQRSEERMLDFNSVNKMLNLMERDLLQAIERSVRGDYGDRLAVFSGDSRGFEFTRGGWANRPAVITTNSRAAHATLQRTGYHLVFAEAKGGGYESRWSRDRWDVLDRVQSSRPQTSLQIVVERVAVRYLSHGKVWSNHWPVTIDANQEDYSALPLAVEVELSLATFGKVRRLFQVSDLVSYYADRAVK